MKIVSIVFFLIIIIISGCKEDGITTPPARNEFSTEIKGTVVLENQTENSNVLIYLDSLNRGVSSDSSGNYILPFTESDSIYTGEFKIIYFLADYEQDSARYFLVKGKVKLDTLDVDNEGKIKTKQLKQLVLIQGWTDKKKYRVGDDITFSAIVTNVSDRPVNIFIGSIAGTFSNFISLYNDKYPPFLLNGEQDILTADLELELKPGRIYGGTVYPKIIGYQPLVPDEYIVKTGFIINHRLESQFQSKFSKYVLFEWYKLCRGTSPKYDKYPNKFKFQHVQIIE